MTSSEPVAPGSGWIVGLNPDGQWHAIGEWSLTDYGVLNATTTDLRWSMHDYPPPANQLRAVRGE